MYALVIPPDLVSELYHIREKTKVSIRKQILDCVKEHVKQYRGESNVESGTNEKNKEKGKEFGYGKERSSVNTKRCKALPLVAAVQGNSEVAISLE